MMNLIRRWLEEANRELDNGCNKGYMDEIPFSAESLDKAQLLINHVLEVLDVVENADEDD